LTRHLVTVAVAGGLLLLLTLSPGAQATNEQADAEQFVDLFTEVFDFVRNHYVDESRVDPETLIQGALDGMFATLDDPHSSYVPPEEIGDLLDMTRGEFGGVGLQISVDPGVGVEVISPLEGQPAYRAGVRPGDVIVAVDGESALEFDANDVVTRLRGEPGTSVSIRFRRGSGINFEVVIERTLIEVPTVRYDTIGDDLGYLRVRQFTMLTPGRVGEALDELQRHDLAGLIVDLRSNPGGVLGAAVEVADYFLSSGVIVSTRSRHDTDGHAYHASQRTRVDPQLPIVVLIDRGSASASEILAAVLQDSARGYLLGEQSYGKGSVQQVRHFGEGAVKLTTARYFTRRNVNLDDGGVLPDWDLREPDLSEEAEEELSELLDAGRVRAFARATPNAGDAQIEEFVTELQRSVVALDRHYLLELVHEVVARRQPSPPAYDLRFDDVLVEAVGLLDRGEVPAPDTGPLREPAAVSVS
jgi:carboxyl-terminal processing protease